MHKLINYVCDELEKIEQQAGSGKLSIAEIEYADKLAHLKKNLLRADELMEAGYSGDIRRWPSSYRGGRSYEDGGSSYARDGGSSYAREGGSSYGRDRGGSSYESRGRGSNAQRDSKGRYSSGRGYSRYVRDDYSMATDEVIEDLRELMDGAPDQRMKQELQRIITKVEQMDD